MVVLTPLADNLFTFIITIEYGNEILRYSTAEKICTDGDGNIYYPDLLIRNSFESFTRDTPIDGDGTIGSIAKVEFSFSGAKYLGLEGSELETEAGEDILTEDDQLINDELLKKFINAWAPSPFSPDLHGSKVTVGFGWLNGSVLTSSLQIIFKGFVREYETESASISISSFEDSDFELITIPSYKVQKDLDNGISYHPEAPEDMIGSVIPIVYGDFTHNTTGWLAFMYEVIVAPAIPIHKRSTSFLVASHECYEVSEDQGLFANSEAFFKYIPDLRAFLFIRNDDYITGSSTINDNRGHILKMTNRGSRLIGAMVLRLVEQSEESDVIDIDNAIDKDFYNYSLIDAGEKIALRVAGIGSTSEIGFLGIAEEDITLRMYASTDGGGDRAYSLNYKNNQIATPAGTTPATGTITHENVFPYEGGELTMLQFGFNTDGQKNPAIPWSIEEVTGLDFILTNNQSTAGEKIYAFGGHLYLSNIKVVAPNWARIVRNSGGVGGGRNAG